MDSWNSKKEWREWIPETNMSLKSCLALCHILQTCAAERLAATLPPTEAKRLVCSSHRGAQSVYGILKQILHADKPVTNPLLLCMRLDFFCSCKKGMGMIRPYCRAGGAFRSQEAQLLVRVGSGCLEFQKKKGGNGFLKQTYVSQISFCTVSHFANMRS